MKQYEKILNIRSLSILLIPMMVVIGCNSKKQKLMEFIPKDYKNSKVELLREFGEPDSVVSFGNGDSSYLFRVEKVCVEWRFSIYRPIPYTKQVNDSCKINEEAFELFDVEGLGSKSTWFDTNISEMWKNRDSVFLISKGINEWEKVHIEISSHDTGRKGELFNEIRELAIQNIKSIRSMSEIRNWYTINYKMGTKKGKIQIKSINFPSDQYHKIDNWVKLVLREMHPEANRSGNE
jgi:hypothetical protein